MSANKRKNTSYGYLIFAVFVVLIVGFYVPKRIINLETQGIGSGISENSASSELSNLKYFKEKVVPTSSKLQELSRTTHIKRVSFLTNDLIKKQSNARSTNLTNEFWVIETTNEESNGESSDPKNLNVGRSIYTFTEDNLTEISNPSANCRIDEMRFVSSKYNISVNTKLKQDMVVLFGPCSDGYYIVTAHFYDTGAQLKFFDPTSLSKKINLYVLSQDTLISNGAVRGYLQKGVYGNEPAIVVNIHRWTSLDPIVFDQNNPSYGIATFSLSSGRLLDAISYENY